MPQLRWMLLVLGVLFLAGLALWESWRGRRARQADLERLAGADPAARDRERERDAEAVADLPLPSFSARDPERTPASRPLPVYEVPPQDPVTPGRRLDPILDFSGDPLLGDGPDVAPEPAVAAPAEPDFDDLGIGPVRVREPPRAAAVPEPLPELHAVAAEPAPAAVAAAAPVLMPAVPEPVVDWPDPEHSRILAVRIVAPGEKFLGRAVRLALTAQGFLPGKFSIYHKPAADGRALLSVAGLTRPGTFDGARVDLQRFSGLNLFTVLPGPLPPAAAAEELLHCAAALAARLHGLLQDEHGEPLTAERMAHLRAAAADPAP